MNIIESVDSISRDERGFPLLRVVKAPHGFSTLPASKMEAKTDVNIPGILKNIHL